LKNKVVIIIFSLIFSIIVWGSITLSDEFFTSYDLNVVTINTPKGFVCGETNPKTIEVKLKAKGWQLLNLNLNPSTEFFVSVSGDSGSITADAYNQIPENTWLGSGTSIIDISPRKISLDVEKIKIKKIKVEAVTDLTFQKGYGLATHIKIYPDSVLVAGPKSAIEKTFSVKTKKISFKSLDRNTKIITELDDLPGFEYQQNQVELTFDVQRIVDNLVEGSKVVVKNIPRDRDVVLIPNFINCSLRGGINIIGKITSDQITASIDYRDIILDTLGSLKPTVNIPANSELLYTKPEELRYIIKKFE
jgi:hypothetical protein